MGEVWLALDEELDDRPVAIKIMHSRMPAGAEDAARFRREMRLAARMQHPNIMTIFTTGDDDGTPFMVMEYLEGSDLSQVGVRLDAGQVARIGRDACAALAYAHAQGVVHRDIKPGNLFLCGTGLLKVTDFGIARAVTRTRLSATGTLVGTFPYMAPEQWLGQPPAFSNDIWATGCVLYELLSGRLPRQYPDPSGLDMLAPEQATQMFTRLAPRASGSLSEVAVVVRLAGFLPLAISLLARLFARHQSWTLADLAAETRTGLLTLTAEHDSVATRA
jgi:serine/threonine-protein kinase